MVMGSDIVANPSRGTNDVQRGLLAGVLRIGATVSATINAARALEIAEREYELANKYWQLAQDWLTYYQNNYAPVEDIEADEAMSLEDEPAYYDAMRGRGRTMAVLQSKGAILRGIRCTSKYCSGLREIIIRDVLKARAQAAALADSAGWRNERAYIEARGDVKFDKRVNTAKRGRDMNADNVSFARNSTNIYADLFEQSWQGLTGAAQFLGYGSARNPTAYPRTYLGGRQSRGVSWSGRNGSTGLAIDPVWARDTADAVSRGELDPVSARDALDGLNGGGGY